MSGDPPDQCVCPARSSGGGITENGVTMIGNLYREYRPPFLNQSRYARGSKTRRFGSGSTWSIVGFMKAVWLTMWLPTVSRIAVVAQHRDERQARRQLLELNDHMLKDLGLNRADLHHEASRPFWHW